MTMRLRSGPAVLLLAAGLVPVGHAVPAAAQTATGKARVDNAIIDKTAKERAGGRKPKPPPGRDPGGVAVAVIGAGVDYRRPDLARRLARDGEGEVIGLDIVDGDSWAFERPLRANDPSPPLRLPLHAGSATAALVLDEAPAARLIAVRAPDGDATAAARAMAFVAQTPARVIVVLVGGGSSGGGPAFDFGAAVGPALIVIRPEAATPANGVGAADRPGHVLTVAAATRDGRLLATGAAAHGAIDLAVPLAAEQIPPEAAVDRDAALGHAAAARLAALAARLAGQYPQLDGAGLKARILSIAKPLPGHAGAAGARLPALWLPDIERAN